MLQVPGWKLGLRREVLGRDAMLRLTPAWDDLCARGVEENVYYSPRYARALINSVDRKTDLHFALAWQEEKLIGLLPFTRPKLSIPLIAAAGTAWRTRYTFNCMPLLDRSQASIAA